MPIAKITTGFDDQIQQLLVNTANAGLSVETGSGGSINRPWNQPDFSGGLWNGDPLDIVNLQSAFDKSDLNTDYINAKTTAGQANGGRLADIYISKVQLDYMNTMLRALAVRYATPIRQKMWAAARLKGHGGSASIFNLMEQYLQNMLNFGYSVPDGQGVVPSS